MTTEIERDGILVVDDEESIRCLLQRILEDAGYRVSTAANGEDAFDKLSSGQIRIMLLDMMMPGMSGIELMHKLADDLPNYCVIMVTAVADVQTATETLKLGAYDYITKPFDRDDVKRKVSRAIGKYYLSMQEKENNEKLQASIIKQTGQMHDQFSELVSSLTREHNLIHQLAKKQADGGKSLLSKLPEELQEPASSAKEFSDALLRILRKSQSN